MKMKCETQQQTKRSSALGRDGFRYLAQSSSRFGFYLNHEVGDLSEYDSSINPDGQITVDAAAALAGTNFGLKVVTDDNTQQAAIKNISMTTDKLQLRILLSIAAGAVDVGNYWTAIMLNGTVDPLYVQLRPTRVVYNIFNSDAGFLGTRISGELAIGETFCLEISIQRATTALSSDGNIRTWFNGIEQAAFANVDNYDSFNSISDIRIGSFFFGGATVTPLTAHFDQIEWNPNGEQIGCSA